MTVKTWRIHEIPRDELMLAVLVPFEPGLARCGKCREDEMVAQGFMLAIGCPPLTRHLSLCSKAKETR